MLLSTTDLLSVSAKARFQWFVSAVLDV